MSREEECLAADARAVAFAHYPLRDGAGDSAAAYLSPDNADNSGGDGHHLRDARAIYADAYADRHARADRHASRDRDGGAKHRDAVLDPYSRRDGDAATNRDISILYANGDDGSDNYGYSHANDDSFCGFQIPRAEANQPRRYDYSRG